LNIIQTWTKWTCGACSTQVGRLFQTYSLQHYGAHTYFSFSYTLSTITHTVQWQKSFRVICRW